MFVAISGNVDGVVWPIHYSDIKLKHPEKKFKIGSSVKARVRFIASHYFFSTIQSTINSTLLFESY